MLWREEESSQGSRLMVYRFPAVAKVGKNVYATVKTAETLDSEDNWCLDYQRSRVHNSPCLQSNMAFFQAYLQALSTVYNTHDTYLKHNKKFPKNLKRYRVERFKKYGDKLDKIAKQV